MLAAQMGSKMTSSGSGGASAGGAAASGAAAAVPPLAIAQAANSAFSAFAEYGSKRQSSYQLEQAAQEERLLASAEGSAALRRVTTLKHEFLDVAGQQRVAFAANGIDLGSGSVKSARAQSVKETDRQINDQLNANDLQQIQRRSRAKQFKKQARDARRAGFFGLAKNVGLGPALLAEKIF